MALTQDHENEFEPGDVIDISGDDTGHLEIRVLSRAAGSDYWDGNWLVCSIELHAGGFAGRFQANFRTNEFDSFHRTVKALYETLRGEAMFAPLEGQLQLRLTGDGCGHITVEGQARDEAGTGNILHFVLQQDQTHLFGTMVQLGELLNRFPVRGSPTV